MASISGVSSSNASSIYGNRNVLSGLASGMDTESMIENAVYGIKLKISGLQQKRTKVEWQQEAYRSIIDKMANFTQKYTSYTSGTNLLSASFFNSAVKAVTHGAFADKISAAGKTSSDVRILGVQQLATAATYKVSGLAGLGADGDGFSRITGVEDFDLAAAKELSTISGTLTLSYGGSRTIDLSFDELEDTYSSVDELAAGIREKLGDIQISNSSGELIKGSDMISVTVKDGSIVFGDKQGAGNTVSVSGATGDIKETLNISPSDKSDTLNVGGTALTRQSTVGEYLSGKEISVTLDGVTKKITLPAYDASAADSQQAFIDKLNEDLGDAFGKNAGGENKILVKVDNGKLSFNSTQKGSTLNISSTSSALQNMGLASENESSYIDTGKTLGELLGDSFDWSKYSGDRTEAVGAVLAVRDEDHNITHYVDSQNNRVAYDKEADAWYRADDKDAFLYDMEINGTVVGSFSENTALESVMLAINNNTEAGVNVSYSKITNQLQFTAQETGSAGRIEMGAGLAQDLFGGGTSTAGSDAILSMEVNGQVMENITRSSNTFDVDGLKVTLKDEFGYVEQTDENGDSVLGADGKPVQILDPDAEAVSFTFSSDSDKIVDAVKSMIEDYNAMVTEIKNAYSTLPAEKSNGDRYEPLTEDDLADMSESAIKSYEEKAKQGILFADRDLSSLYSKLRSAITPGGDDGALLRSIGINTSYSEGLTTLTLDEDALRTALENNPDNVKNIFTKTVDGGASSNGLMQSLKTQLDAYAKVTGEKGILVQRAGSIKAPVTLNDNTLQDQLDSFDEQIERWETKLADQVDRYTSQFTRLEQLIAQMNSQSSALMQFSGGSY